MRKMIMAFIAAFVVIAVGLVILLVNKIDRREDADMIFSSNAKLVNEQNAKLDGIDTLELEFYSDDIVFYTSDTDELMVKEYKNFTPEQDQLAVISTTGSNLKIKGCKYYHKGILGFVNYYGRTEIYLPEGYTGALSVSTSSGNINSDLVLRPSQFDASCTSGDIGLNELYAENISIASSSGNITIKKAEGARDISSTSGDIEVYSGSGDSNFSSSSGNITIEASSGNLSVSTNSGDLKIKGSDGDKQLESTSGNITVEDSTGFVKASASSGDIRINTKSGAGDIDTTSGNIKFTVDEVNGDINLHASSGDIICALPASASFNFSADTSSGDINTFFDDALSYNKKGNRASGTIGSNPDKTVELSATSGNVKVLKK